MINKEFNYYDNFRCALNNVPDEQELSITLIFGKHGKGQAGLSEVKTKLTKLGLSEIRNGKKSTERIKLVGFAKSWKTAILFIKLKNLINAEIVTLKYNNMLPITKMAIH